VERVKSEYLRSVGIFSMFHILNERSKNVFPKTWDSYFKQKVFTDEGSEQLLAATNGWNYWRLTPWHREARNCVILSDVPGETRELKRKRNRKE
jgi:hypothetical protein